MDFGLIATGAASLIAAAQTGRLIKRFVDRRNVKQRQVLLQEQARKLIYGEEANRELEGKIKEQFREDTIQRLKKQTTAWVMNDNLDLVLRSSPAASKNYEWNAEVAGLKEQLQEIKVKIETKRAKS